MPADASIYNAFAIKPKSVAEYDQEYAAAEDAKANRQLNLLKLQGAQQEMANNAARRNYLAGADLSTPQGITGLARFDPKLAFELQGKQTEAQKNAALTGKAKAETAASQFKLQQDQLNHGIQAWTSASTPEQAKTSIMEGMQLGYFSPEQAQATIAQLPADPQQYQAFRQQKLMGLISGKDRLELERQQRNDLIGPDGRVNQPLLDAKKSISKSGASNVSVKVDAKLGEGLANQVGPMMKDSAGAAEGAARQIDAANRIVGAVDSNKLFAGPGAETRLTVAQISDTLGIGGNTNAEKIANTRQVLQGLSQLTLQGRQQMRGQGAITENESKLAERATSGDINMTPAEIRQLANAAKRAANYMQSEHQRKLNVMRQNPNLAGMVPFYDVAPVPSQGGNVIDFGSLK